MRVSFEKVKIGNSYSRRQLAELWGYAGYQALARGVVTPKNDNKVLLFITFDKPGYIEQYEDELRGETLHWEGPTDHFAENRMINAKVTGDQIHVFYRARHHSDFVYEGKYIVTSYTINSNRPSKFVLNRAS